MHSDLQNAIESAIAEATGEPFCIQSSTTSSGGCINDARIVADRNRRFFVKVNAASALDTFTAEAEALDALAATRTIRVPQPITHGQAANQAYLVLEALDFGSPGKDGWVAMGRQLADLHRHTADRFGWHRANVIGSTPQSNRRHERWADFYREERLRPQFDLARRNGFRFDRADELLDAVEGLLANHSPQPSLLHGDLWSGNASFLADGTPALFDPASYYGDREADLAFTEFFGGFSRDFYDTYAAAWPLPDCYERRKTLYNLYHVLNHANLFGSSYAGQADNMIHELLAQ